MFTRITGPKSLNPAGTRFENKVEISLLRCSKLNFDIVMSLLGSRYVLIERFRFFT